MCLLFGKPVQPTSKNGRLSVNLHSGFRPILLIQNMPFCLNCTTNVCTHATYNLFIMKETALSCIQFFKIYLGHIEQNCIHCRAARSAIRCFRSCRFLNIFPIFPDPRSSGKKIGIGFKNFFFLYRLQIRTCTVFSLIYGTLFFMTGNIKSWGCAL